MAEKLYFSVASKLKKSLHDKLVKSFNKQLENVINHTSSLGRSYIRPSDIGNIVDQNYLGSIQKTQEVSEVFLANSLQQGFICQYLKSNGDDAYVVQMIWQYNNKLNVELLKQAWVYAQRKYPTFRLRFLWDNELVQIIDKQSNVDFRYVDISKFDNMEQEIEKIQVSMYSCIFSSHHSILDGWSIPILQSYIHATYLNLFNNQTVDSNEDVSYLETQEYVQKNQFSNNPKFVEY